MTEAADRMWRCEKCGAEYTADVGKCGQLQPPCDGAVWEASRYDPATRTHYVPVGPDVQEAASRGLVMLDSRLFADGTSEDDWVWLETPDGQSLGRVTGIAAVVEMRPEDEAEADS